MKEVYFANVRDQVNHGITRGDMLASVVYAGLEMHLEALDHLAYDIESLRNEIVKIEQKLGTEDLNQENKESNTL